MQWGNHTRFKIYISHIVTLMECEKKYLCGIILMMYDTSFSLTKLVPMHFNWAIRMVPHSQQEQLQNKSHHFEILVDG